MRKTRAVSIRMLEKRLFAGLLGVLVVLAGLYSYFLVNTVVNVVVRKEAEQEIAVLHSHLGELETAYIKQQDTIDLAHAESLGFSSISEKKYVTRRDALGQSLTFDR